MSLTINLPPLGDVQDYGHIDSFDFLRNSSNNMLDYQLFQPLRESDFLSGGVFNFMYNDDYDTIYDSPEIPPNEMPSLYHIQQLKYARASLTDGLLINPNFIYKNIRESFLITSERKKLPQGRKVVSAQICPTTSNRLTYIFHTAGQYMSVFKMSVLRRFLDMNAVESVGMQYFETIAYTDIEYPITNIEISGSVFGPGSMPMISVQCSVPQIAIFMVCIGSSTLVPEGSIPCTRTLLHSTVIPCMVERLQFAYQPISVAWDMRSTSSALRSAPCLVILTQDSAVYIWQGKNSLRQIRPPGLHLNHFNLLNETFQTPYDSEMNEEELKDEFEDEQAEEVFDEDSNIKPTRKYGRRLKPKTRTSYTCGYDSRRIARRQNVCHQVIFGGHPGTVLVFSRGIIEKINFSFPVSNRNVELCLWTQNISVPDFSEYGVDLRPFFHKLLKIRTSVQLDEEYRFQINFLSNKSSKKNESSINLTAEVDDDDEVFEVPTQRSKKTNANSTKTSGKEDDSNSEYESNSEDEGNSSDSSNSLLPKLDFSDDEFEDDIDNKLATNDELRAQLEEIENQADGVDDNDEPAKRISRRTNQLMSIINTEYLTLMLNEKEYFRCAAQHPTIPYRFVLVTTFRVFLMDERKIHEPLLQWSHHFYHYRKTKQLLNFIQSSTDCPQTVNFIVPEQFFQDTPSVSGQTYIVVSTLSNAELFAYDEGIVSSMSIGSNKKEDELKKENFLKKSDPYHYLKLQSKSQESKSFGGTSSLVHHDPLKYSLQHSIKDHIDTLCRKLKAPHLTDHKPSIMAQHGYFSPAYISAPVPRKLGFPHRLFAAPTRSFHPGLHATSLETNWRHPIHMAGCTIIPGIWLMIPPVKPDRFLPQIYIDRYTEARQNSLNIFQYGSICAIKIDVQGNLALQFTHYSKENNPGKEFNLEELARKGTDIFSNSDSEGDYSSSYSNSSDDESASSSSDDSSSSDSSASSTSLSGSRSTILSKSSKSSGNTANSSKSERNFSVPKKTTILFPQVDDYSDILKAKSAAIEIDTLPPMKTFRFSHYRMSSAKSIYAREPLLAYKLEDRNKMDTSNLRHTYLVDCSPLTPLLFSTSGEEFRSRGSISIPFESERQELISLANYFPIFREKYIEFLNKKNLFRRRQGRKNETKKRKKTVEDPQDSEYSTPTKKRKMNKNDETEDVHYLDDIEESSYESDASTSSSKSSSSTSSSDSNSSSFSSSSSQSSSALSSPSPSSISSSSSSSISSSSSFDDFLDSFSCDFGDLHPLYFFAFAGYINSTNFDAKALFHMPSWEDDMIGISTSKFLAPLKRKNDSQYFRPRHIKWECPKSILDFSLILGIVIPRIYEALQHQGMSCNEIYRLLVRTKTISPKYFPISLCRALLSRLTFDHCLLYIHLQNIPIAIWESQLLHSNSWPSSYWNSLTNPNISERRPDPRSYYSTVSDDLDIFYIYTPNVSISNIILGQTQVPKAALVPNSTYANSALLNPVDYQFPHLEQEKQVQLSLYPFPYIVDEEIKMDTSDILDSDQDDELLFATQPLTQPLTQSITSIDRHLSKQGTQEIHNTSQEPPSSQPPLFRMISRNNFSSLFNTQPKSESIIPTDATSEQVFEFQQSQILEQFATQSLLLSQQQSEHLQQSSIEGNEQLDLASSHQTEIDAPTTPAQLSGILLRDWAPLHETKKKVQPLMQKVVTESSKKLAEQYQENWQSYLQEGLKKRQN